MTCLQIILPITVLLVIVERATAGCQSDVLLVIDNSGSVVPVFDLEKEVAAKTVEVLKVAADSERVALIQFNEAAHLVSSFDHGLVTKLEVAEKLRNLTKIGGTTNTLAALELALDEFRTNARQQSGVNRLLIIVTDGFAQNTWESLVVAVHKLQEIGVVVFAASASPEFGVDDLLLYAGGDFSHVFLKANLTDLPNHIKTIVTNQQCILPAVAQKGFKPVDVSTAVEKTPEVVKSPLSNANIPAVNISTINAVDATPTVSSFVATPTVAQFLSTSSQCQCTCAPPAAVQPTTENPTNVTQSRQLRLHKKKKVLH